MVIKSVNLETVCGVTSKMPDNTLPEVAFAGKSNVGNFYNINDEILFVDLPGYGYANANVKVKQQWGKMIERYLHSSKMLKRVFLLIDIRHAPGANDCDMYQWIVHNGFEPVIIATKLDKIKRSQLDKQIKLIRDTLRVSRETVIIPFSAETKQGRDEIYEILEQLI